MKNFNENQASSDEPIIGACNCCGEPLTAGGENANQERNAKTLDVFADVVDKHFGWIVEHFEECGVEDLPMESWMPVLMARFSELTINLCSSATNSDHSEDDNFEDCEGDCESGGDRDYYSDQDYD